ncbi:MAG: helix-turn-helix domain-containing protein [Clostridiales bacterium]|nr:helix-turn-helix domain-containing protein [Clostridiales bacterium]
MNEEEIRTAVAANIVRYRRQFNLTQAELAEMLNYSDKAVSKWERAESVPDVYILKQLSGIFGVTVDGLLSGEREEKPAVKKLSTRVRLLVPIMSALILFFLMTVAFSVLTMLPVDWKRSWLLFVYVLPAVAVVFIVFSAIWGKALYTALFVSALIWSLALSLFLTFELDNTFLLFIIAAPLQILTALGWWLFRSHKKKPDRLAAAVPPDKKKL